MHPTQFAALITLYTGKMKMTYSHAAGLDLPSEFNTARYDSVNKRAAIIADPNSSNMPERRNAWHVYASAWNGIAFRLRAAREYHQEFARSISKNTAPGGDERYIQERSLFGCASSALSAVECFFMAAYSLGSVLDQHSFPLGVSRDMVKYPDQVSSCFLIKFPSALLTRRMSDVVKSPEFLALKDVRNALSHRGIFPRRHFLTVGTAPVVRDIPSSIPENPKNLPKDYSFSAHLSDQTTEVHLRWSLDTLNTLVCCLDDFLADLSGTENPA